MKLIVFIFIIFIQKFVLQIDMGDNESKAVSVMNEDLPKLSHQKFANRRFITNNEGQTFIIIKHSVPSERQYQKWKESLKNIQNHQFLMLPTIHSFSKTGFCGSNGIVDIIYEKYPFILSDQIQNRSQLDNKFFQESQLWYLIFTLLEAANYFHLQGRKIGDIRPENIFISDDGSVKVACRQSWPNEVTNYERSFQKQITYISPEEIQDLQQGRVQPTANLELSQTFSIGLTALDAATLGNSNLMYIANDKFNPSVLQARLTELDSLNYGIYLRLLIRNMVQLPLSQKATPQKRTKAVDLYKWLLPYQEEINNFAPFEPKYLPANFPQLINNLNAISHNNPAHNYNITSNYTSSETYPPKFQYNTFKPPTYQAQKNPLVKFNPPSVDSKPATTVIGSNSASYQYKQFVSNPPLINDYVNAPQALNQNNIVESTYVPYTSKFSLQKIDQQLNNSRKLFPS